MTETAEAPDRQRFAIYLTPHQDTPLSKKAAAWLGRDPWADCAVKQPSFDGISPEAFQKATAAPRRYGFHATVTAPFEAAPGTTVETIRDRAIDFVKTQKSARAVLRPQMLTRYLALLAENQSEIADLARNIVEAFHPLQAPLSDHDRDRRMAAKLTPRQSENLERWGYPYVMDDFFFHMTLAGPLSDDAVPLLRTAATSWFAEELDGPFAFDGIALFHQASPKALFTVDSYFAFETD